MRLSLLPLYMQHYLMLSRNLFYTGLTRAKKLAIIIGQEKPISIAVKQVKDRLRYTKLKERLVTQCDRILIKKSKTMASMKIHEEY